MLNSLFKKQFENGIDLEERSDDDNDSIIPHNINVELHERDNHKDLMEQNLIFSKENEQKSTTISGDKSDKPINQ